MPNSSIFSTDNPLPCAGSPELFYPPMSGEKKKERELRTARAVRLCEGCEIRVQCEAYGRENERYGIWGGIDVTTLHVRRDRAS